MSESEKDRLTAAIDAMEHRSVCVCGFLVAPDDPLPAVLEGSEEDTAVPYPIWCKRHAHKGSLLEIKWDAVTTDEVTDNGDGTFTHTIRLPH